MRRKMRGRGFTLVELLVVIAIIGILVALLLPAIQAAREAARRTQCNNNLKNVALALQNYHDTYKAFPSGTLRRQKSGNWATSGSNWGPSWWYGIMPFVEQRNIYDKISDGHRPGGACRGYYYSAIRPGNNNTGLRGSLHSLVPDFMRCPSSPLPVTYSQTAGMCLPSYVGIAGGCDIDQANTKGQYVAPSGANPGDFRPPTSARVYQNKWWATVGNNRSIYTLSGMLPPWCVTTNIAKCTDGTSNTMIVGEQSDWLRNIDPTISTTYHGDAGWHNGSWMAGWLSSSGSRLNNPNAIRDGNGLSHWWRSLNLTVVRYKPDLKRVMGSASPYGEGGAEGCDERHYHQNQGINNPLQSPHPGGLLVGMVDGSVQFISGTTDLALLLRLAIRDDGQNVDWNN